MSWPSEVAPVCKCVILSQVWRPEGEGLSVWKPEGEGLSVWRPEGEGPSYEGEPQPWALDSSRLVDIMEIPDLAKLCQWETGRRQRWWPSQLSAGPGPTLLPSAALSVTLAIMSTVSLGCCMHCPFSTLQPPSRLPQLWGCSASFALPPPSMALSLLHLFSAHLLWWPIWLPLTIQPWHLPIQHWIIYNKWKK